MARLGAYKIPKRKPVEKTPFILNPQEPDDFEENLWLAIEGQWVSMYADAGFEPNEIEEILNRDVKAYIDEMRSWANKVGAETPASERRKLR